MLLNSVPLLFIEEKINALAIERFLLRTGANQIADDGQWNQLDPNGRRWISFSFTVVTFHLQKKNCPDSIDWMQPSVRASKKQKQLTWQFRSIH